jgi:hypothetical protein
MPGENGEFDDDEELLLETEAPEDELAEDDESVITLGEEAEEVEEETPVIKQLRQKIREQSRRLREVEQTATTAKPKAGIGPEPTMEDEDVDWDQDKFKTKLANWIKSKADNERAEADAKAAAEKQNAAWNAQLATYEQNKAKLMVTGKEEAEEEALAKLSQIQQSIIVKHPNNAAIMIALGKYPKKLDAVSAIADPVDFTYAIGDIGRELKVTARRKAPEPDAAIRGDAPLSGGTATATEKKRNAILDKMTQGGDVSKYRAQLRAIDAR